MSSKRFSVYLPPNLQYRTVGVRSNESNSGVSGYASHFGSVDSYGTAMQRGAFADTLKRRAGKIPVLWNHHSDNPIGVPKVLREDRTGLYFHAKLSESTTDGARIMGLLRDGVPLGMSFGFQTLSQRPATDADNLDYSSAPRYFQTVEGKKEVRVIEEVELFEISIVTFPANEKATINAVRKGRNRYAEIQRIEADLVLDLVAAQEREDAARQRDRQTLIDELLGVA